MSRWLLVLVLSVASATAWAQPAATPSIVTAKAQADTSNLARRVAQLTQHRNALAKQYAEQVVAVDRLKKQRSSWRQQRELRDRLAEAQDTASKLTAVTADLARANSSLGTARRALVTAIDAELAAGAGGPRATELARLRAQHVQQAPRRVQRIVLPDLEIDQLADPEELDQQAAALRESEQQLQNQIAGLEKQASDLDAVARLKKQHERAGDLARRDDDQPQRTAVQGTGLRTAAEADASSAPQSSDGFGNGGTSGLSSGGGFESEASIVLAEVVDAGTIDTLTRAQRSGDPAQRAQAAKKTRDAVAGRLEQLRKKRAEIEALSKARKQRR
ncbi:MAG: hypothetical protein SFX73_33390 [Kofleriaceae bacterium]|nr:hypothetical protein [Kofleriaceae bacterium]